MKKHIATTGSVLADCPDAVTASQNHSTSFTGDLNQFIRELILDLPPEWKERFDFAHPVPFESENNHWQINVRDRKCVSDNYCGTIITYPQWCTVYSLEKFGQLFAKSNKYQCNLKHYCTVVDFWDCFARLTRGAITVQFYWEQF